MEISPRRMRRIHASCPFLQIMQISVTVEPCICATYFPLLNIFQEYFFILQSFAMPAKLRRNRKRLCRVESDLTERTPKERTALNAGEIVCTPPRRTMGSTSPSRKKSLVLCTKKDKTTTEKPCGPFHKSIITPTTTPPGRCDG